MKYSFKIGGLVTSKSHDQDFLQACKFLNVLGGTRLYSNAMTINKPQ